LCFGRVLFLFRVFFFFFFSLKELCAFEEHIYNITTSPST